MESLREILTNLGYSVTETAKEFRARPIYRDSGNSTSLRINKSTWNFHDYGWGISGNFAELVKLTLNLKNVEEAQTLLKNKYNFTLIVQRPKPELRGIKTFDSKLLTKLMPLHDYWLNRGIPIEILRKFRGGLVKEKSAFRDYYVFPIFDSKDNIIGFSARNTLNDNRPKWRKKGASSEWKYPLFLNYQDIKEKQELIIIESIGDGLSLETANITNYLITFGIELSIPLLNCILKLDPNNIVIALNNDGENNAFIGNEASTKMKTKLSKFFDARQIKIHLPPMKDFNELLQMQGIGAIENWYAGI